MACGGAAGMALLMALISGADQCPCTFDERGSSAWSRPGCSPQPLPQRGLQPGPEGHLRMAVLVYLDAPIPDACTDSDQQTGVQAIAPSTAWGQWRSSSEMEKITALWLAVACRSCRKERRQYTRCSQRGPP